MIGPRKPSGLSAAQQFSFLRNNELCVGKGKLSRGRLKWWFEIRPTPLSRTYLVEIDYEQFDVPKVRVLQPNLTELATGRDIPHIYHDPVRLCLYSPHKNQWHARSRLDQTIVPWTALWLYYFEEWLVSNVWKGEGEHPSSSESVGGNRRDRRYRTRRCLR